MSIINLKLKVLGQIVFILFFVCLNSINGQTLTIDGRVIDKTGKAIPNALVELQTKCDTCPDITLPSTRTNEDGVFYFDPRFGMPSRIYLYITAPVPSDVWNPFDGFESRVAESLRLKPIVVSTKKSGIIHLNNIKPTMSYKITKLNLRKLFGLEPDKIINSAEFISVKVVSPQGIFKAIQVPADFISENLSDFKFALPKGFIWKLRFEIKIDISKRVVKYLTIR